MNKHKHYLNRISLETKLACRGQHRSDRTLGLIGRLALNTRLGARLYLYRWARGARLGVRAVRCRATRAWARRALADFARLGACADTRWALRYR